MFMLLRVEVHLGLLLGGENLGTVFLLLHGAVEEAWMSIKTLQVLASGGQQNMPWHHSIHHMAAHCIPRPAQHNTVHISAPQQHRAQTIALHYSAPHQRTA